VPSSLATNGIDVANSIWGSTNALTFEGATADGFEMDLEPSDIGQDVDMGIGDIGEADGSFLISELDPGANDADDANAVWGISNGLSFEGATADAFETLLVAQDADTGVHTFQLPDNNAAADTYNLVFSVLDTNALNVANSIWMEQNSLVFEGATGADTFQMDIAAEDPVAADRTWTLPDYDADAVFIGTTLVTNAPNAANSFWGTAAGVLFEGATADAFELTLSAVDPVQDAQMQFHDVGLNLVMASRDGAGGRSAVQGVPNPFRIDFRDASVANAVCQLDDLSAVCGVADTNVNNVSVGYGLNFEFWVELANGGGITAALNPHANGWLLESDDTNNEGAQGMFFGADDDFDVGLNCVAQTDACYFEASVIITDSSETDQVLFGWLVREAYAADAEEDAFDTYCLVGVDDAVADPRDIVVSEEVNGDGGANTDTTAQVVDGTAFILRVELDADGTCDVWVDGTETNADVGGAAFDAADFAVPYFSVLNSAGDGTPDPDVIIQWVEFGYLN
jgi:hypothetical protein